MQDKNASARLCAKNAGGGGGGGAYLRDTTIYFWWYWKHYVLLHCNLTFKYCSYSIAVFILLKIIDCRFTPGHLEQE